MFHLPDDIIRYIYEFDNTYRNVFDECLQCITMNQIYKSRLRNLYYVYIEDKNVLHMTNDIKKPSYICSSFNIRKSDLDDLLRRYQMERKYNIKLEYDIENYIFKDTNFF